MIQEAGFNFCKSMSLELNQYNYMGYIYKKVYNQAWYKNIKKQTQNTTSKPKKDGTAKLKCPSQCTKTNQTTEGSLQCFKLQSRYPIPLEAPQAVVKSGFPYTAPSLSTASDLSEPQPNIASMLPSPQTRA